MAAPLQEFCDGGYEILDAGLRQRRELAIRADDPLLPPAIGDLFTVEIRGVVVEVAVVQLTAFDGGWTAICRITDVF